MDHWGDPWADETKTKTPPEEELGGKKAIEAPAVLSGFENEAQWGDLEDAEDFGGWSAFSPPPFDAGVLQEGSQSKTTYSLTSAESLHQRIPENIRQSPPRSPASHDTNPIYYGEFDVDLGGDQIASSKTRVEHFEHWEQHSQIASLGSSPSAFGSELSDSNTTIHPDVALSGTSTELELSIALEDDASTRPSTSPSDASQPEIQPESPRTSFEEERVISEDIPVIEDVSATQDGLDAKQPGEEDDDFGDFEGEEEEEVLTSETRPEELMQSVNSPVPAVFLEQKAGLEQLSKAENDITYKENETTHSAVSFHPDLSLVEQLFSPAPLEDLPPAPDSTISSTSARKAWYRITRKQTMREFNNGNDDDNYVRVTWMNSNIRLEVNKIVARWSAEDRIAGRATLGGKSAAATFFWDQPPTGSEQGVSQRHSRKRSSLSSSALSSPLSSTKSNGLVIPDTSPVAQFNWSSFPVSPKAHSTQGTDIKGKKIVMASTPITPSPLSRKSARASKARGHEAKSVSLDASTGIGSEAFNKRASQSSGSSITHTIATMTPEPPKISNELDILNSANPSGWSQPASKEIPKATDPVSVEARPLPTQNLSIASDPWASLTRLDTSSQEPLASNIPTLDDNDDWGEMVQSPATPILGPTFTPAKEKPLIQSLPSTLRPAVPSPPATSSAPVPHPSTTSIPIAIPSIQPYPDPLATADFSIFETPAAPPPRLAPPHAPPSSSALPKHLRYPSIPVPSSSYSLPRPSSSRPTSLPPPPRSSVLAPPSAAKRKEDEDAEIVRRIIAGVPDLSYMLR
ncbi:hypothetical protein AOQ84DRAFT_435729 [Glonium stellatum]|uniref:Uncharacterized protein n=1 Tax=Glonium stellatum TaxID=574774 RepID=A0A8E2FCK6_9PEZI|nr:hypothetical protein AOQ84DRAFT_435729 [Glonium stellatum]